MAKAQVSTWNTRGIQEIKLMYSCKYLWAELKNELSALSKYQLDNSVPGIIS